MPVLVQYVPGNTAVHRLDPRTKLAMAAVVLILAFLFDNAFLLLGLFLAVLAIWIWIKAPMDFVRNLFIALIAFMIFIVLIQGLFWQGAQRTVLIDLFPSWSRVGPIARIIGESWDPHRGGILVREGVIFGISLGFRLGAVLTIMPLITMTTQVQDLTLALESMGVPWRIAYIVLTTFRFIPVLLAQTNTILNAQKLRGLEVEKAGLVKKVTAYAPLAVPVILGAFRNSEQLEMVLECRGFAQATNRTSLYEIVWKREDTVAILLFVLLIVVAIYLRLAGYAGL
ncbi:MAG: energy-coupling factor transporter transmembrane protein EcfT [Chloroflexi bacterium]|nr:energy-coupling factor transporter transmembrane protein EcfT [Chloroflexota bacterium]MCL5074433.1 energy-coupling factor transporter transmembrane protein EcfT [Chloroflexota bacterium]